MKLIYIANIGLPSDWAHSVQIMKMCEAFAQNGADVELVVSSGRNSGYNTDPFSFYNIKPIFKITKVLSVNLFPGNPSAVWYWIRVISFLISSKIYLLTKKYDFIYTREIYAGFFFKKIVFERHSVSKKVTKRQVIFFNISKGVIVLTSFIKSKLTDFGVDPKKIFIAPDAVRIEDFSEMFSTEVARAKINLPKDIHLFGYIGTLKTMGMEKGVSTAIDSLVFLPTTYCLYVVGGEYDDIEYYKKYALEKKVNDRVIFSGKVPHKDIPLHISACDILVSPFPKNEHYSYYMSPLKIFEYMASKKPVVVSDLPSLREVLEDRKTALFVPPNDPEKLASSIEYIINDKNFGEEIANNAYQKVVKDYTWKNRAEKILKFIQS